MKLARLCSHLSGVEYHTFFELPDRPRISTMRRIYSEIKDWVTRYFRSVFSIDPRSLAAFRILLGIIILADLAVRSGYLRAHYTDFGVLPRAPLIQDLSGPANWSFHYMSGEASVQIFLFLIAAFFALMLIIGYRTRLATVVSWLLLLSLHNRNYLVLNSGDTLLRLLLFWAMFLPLGQRYSVDSMGKKDSETTIMSAGVAGLYLQVVFVFFFNGLIKLQGDIWPQGKGLAYVLSLEHFTTTFGDFLSTQGELLTVGSYAFLCLLLSSPALAFIPWLRNTMVLLLAASQIGIASMMHVGLFPVIVICGLIPFMTSSVWGKLQDMLSSVSHWKRSVLDYLKSYNSPVRERSLSLKVIPWSKETVAMAFLVFILLWNVQATFEVDAIPDSAEPVAEYAGIDQHWKMFAPTPLQVDGWYVVPGILENDTRIDAYTREDVAWSKPDDVSEIYPNQRWRKYMTKIWEKKHSDHRLYFGKYLCRRWNMNHETKLQNFTIYYVEQETVLGAVREPTENVSLWNHRCFD